MTDNQLENQGLNANSGGGSLDLRLQLERALEIGGRPVHRLGSAHTSVTFRVAGDDARSVTILLDRHPPELTSANEPAEITIEFDERQAQAFAGGALILPNCVLRGEVSYTGPVRKYLTFDPILRSLLDRAAKPT